VVWLCTHIELSTKIYYALTSIKECSALAYLLGCVGIGTLRFLRVAFGLENRLSWEINPLTDSGSAHNFLAPPLFAFALASARKNSSIVCAHSAGSRRGCGSYLPRCSLPAKIPSIAAKTRIK
jgi:hypothetical protein